MNDRKLGRREFLQAVGATTLLAGLAHFRFLNITANTALASPLDGCAPPTVPDYCNPGEDPDICPDTNATSSDVCLPGQSETDTCDAGTNEPDDCNSGDQPPDTCVPDQGDPDGCEQPPVNTPDTCRTAPDDHDICPDGIGGNGDICNETGPKADADECIAVVKEPDSCSVSAEPDFCRNPSTGLVEHDLCIPAPPQNDPDICFENGHNVVDICDPAGSDADLPPHAEPVDIPTAVALRSFAGQPAAGSAVTSLPMLGGVAAGAAVVWVLHRRMKHDQDEKDGG